MTLFSSRYLHAAAFRVCHLLMINSAHVLSKRALGGHDPASPPLHWRESGSCLGPGRWDGWQQFLPVWTQDPGALFTICGPCAKYRQEQDRLGLEPARGTLLLQVKPFSFFLSTSYLLSTASSVTFPCNESVLLLLPPSSCPVSLHLHTSLALSCVCDSITLVSSC